jgi:hypothetical protein
LLPHNDLRQAFFVSSHELKRKLGLFYRAAPFPWAISSFIRPPGPNLATSMMHYGDHGGWQKPCPSEST